MSFLRKIERIQPREKNRIQVDLKQVVEIFQVLTGERIGGPVAAGHGVHEGIHGTPDHHEKRIPYRVLPAATQGCMFQDMSDTG